MADDERLLELLARALDPGDAEPPADRVAALRIQAAARRQPEPVAPAPPAGPAATAPPPPPAPIPLRPPAPAPVPTSLRRRAGWIGAGLAVAAAAVVVALVAGPALLRGRGDETSVASGPASTTRDAVTRLRAALVSRDPVSVARADAELVRLARQLPPEERAAVEAVAVQAHVEAIQFLREHRTPDVLAAVPPGSEQLPPTTGDAPVPTTVPGGEPAVPTTTGTPPVPTTVVVPDLSVTISSVTPTIDGTFAVHFTVSGFTPDASRRPGSHAVRFFFDDGQKPQVWDGPSPWTFATETAIRFHQVCAVVVDARGSEEPGSGTCVPIL
jgi:hypothetical protein